MQMAVNENQMHMVSSCFCVFDNNAILWKTLKPQFCFSQCSFVSSFTEIILCL